MRALSAVHSIGLELLFLKKHTIVCFFRNNNSIDVLHRCKVNKYSFTTYNMSVSTSGEYNRFTETIWEFNSAEILSNFIFSLISLIK